MNSADAGTILSTHVSGVMALIRSANPVLSSYQVRLLLSETALDLGGAGRDSTYGYGLVDALAAVEAALARR